MDKSKKYILSFCAVLLSISGVCVFYKDATFVSNIHLPKCIC